MFIAETRTFGFQNVFAHAEKQCWALLQTGPQVRKLWSQGLGLRICEPISYRKHLRICGKIVEIYHKSATSITRIVSAISKKIRFYDSMYRQIWVDVFLNYNNLSLTSSVLLWNNYFPEFCYSYSKMSWLKIKKLPTACFCEGKLRLFEVAKGCTRRL